MSSVNLDEIVSKHLPAPVQYGILNPDVERSLPLCILLLGAGGSADTLFDLKPIFDSWWSKGAVSPMLIASVAGGLDYYIQEEDGTIRWDSFLTADLIPALRSRFRVDRCAIAGISGGGYGALKVAFAYPSMFDAVAVMQPMLEPGLRESDVGPRNRLHHVAGGPSQIIGAQRDPVLWESNNPANRARQHAEEIRDSGMAIYIEAADNDFLNAHDGAEFLHRLLWALDLSHEYRLVRAADHGGPTMRPRLGAMFSWLSSVWHEPDVERTAEEIAAVWLESGMQGKPPSGATTTHAFIRFLRGRFEPIRARALETDPTTTRRFGVL
jgi:S-formylglutathione hydrolase